MEYERALFRVYESCLDGLRPSTTENTFKTCLIIEKLILICLFLFLLILCYLHFLFVNSQGCLPLELMKYSNSYSNVTSFNFTNDQIIQLTINSNLFFSDSSFSSLNVKTKEEEEEEEIEINKRILQSSFLYNKTNSSLSFIPSLNHTNITIPSSSSSNSTISSPIKQRIPDYEFTKSIHILQLSKEIREKHSFQIINLTFSSQCLGTIFQQNLIPFGGIDIVILNNFISTFPLEGAFKSKDGEIFTWKDRKNINKTFFSWITLKFIILTKSLFSFFILSTTTALLVRILISSGVVLLLPLFWIFQVNKQKFFLKLILICL